MGRQARQGNMATIDSALSTAPITPVTEQTSVIEPHAAPPVPGSETETEQPKLSDEQEKILAAQEKLLGKEKADALRQEQLDKANQSKAFKAASSAVNNAQRIGKQADLSVGRIPTPGDITFPLILLAVCFFILIQVNGYSRLSWLWLTLTGNAQVTPSAQGSATGGGGPTTPTVSQAQDASQVVMPVLALPAPSFSKTGMSEAY